MNHMESLYAKLYDKYTKLKREKESEMEKLNREQEVKFLKYVSAADEMIEYLRGENDTLRAQVNDLRSEVASVRSTKDEQHAEYQKLLIQENQRNKELSEEIERLRNLQREGLCCSARVANTESRQLNTPGGVQVGSDASSGLDIATRKRTRSSRTETEMKKRSRHSMIETDVTVTPSTIDEPDNMPVTDPLDKLRKQNMSSSALLNINLVHMPECCRRTIDDSGDDAQFTGPTKCMFQDLVECLIGMKLSTVSQEDEICISALHQSSGYSFSLTWIKNSFGETELLYRVSSLGTFERVAPEWMREVLMFSTSMCPIFFERVSRVVKFSH
ncbi:unnamed protein product [Ilex paraguariensis]|uniref:DUF7806 domain-containing protein n=1 Tax=Ilex paraguariensis TaxID=185542 RepID=A0ABC8UTG1_9AQUA